MQSFSNFLFLFNYFALNLIIRINSPFYINLFFLIFQNFLFFFLILAPLSFCLLFSSDSLLSLRTLSFFCWFFFFKSDSRFVSFLFFYLLHISALFSLCLFEIFSIGYFLESWLICFNWSLARFPNRSSTSMTSVVVRPLPLLFHLRHSKQESIKTFLRFQSACENCVFVSRFLRELLNRSSLTMKSLATLLALLVAFAIYEQTRAESVPQVWIGKKILIANLRELKRDPMECRGNALTFPVVEKETAGFHSASWTAIEKWGSSISFRTKWH